MRKTVAIQTRSVIGERNNRSLVGNNRFPTENNGSYCTRRPMKIEVWKRYCTIPCDIPFERYFLGYAINHTKRNGGGHSLN